MSEDIPETRIENYGFDIFVGRESDGKTVNVVSLDLQSLGTLSFMENTLEGALELLCLDVKQGKKVLLTKSPGRTGLREEVLDDPMDTINNYFEGDCVKIRKIRRVFEPKTCHALTSEELKKLEFMYERLVNMKGFPNPFLYQPEGER
jgi:hypothetical protein